MQLCRPLRGYRSDFASQGLHGGPLSRGHCAQLADDRDRGLLEVGCCLLLCLLQGVAPALEPGLLGDLLALAPIGVSLGDRVEQICSDSLKAVAEGAQSSLHVLNHHFARPLLCAQAILPGEGNGLGGLRKLHGESLQLILHGPT